LTFAVLKYREYVNNTGYGIYYVFWKDLIGWVFFLGVTWLYFKLKERGTFLSAVMHVLFILYYIPINAAYPIDDNSSTLSLLRTAHHNEYEEFESAYPAFAEKAREEGYPDIAAHFAMIAKIEGAHGDRFAMYANLLEQDKLFLNQGQTIWVCLNCGHIHTAADAPQVCPVCDHPQGYFIRKTYEPYSC
jgi:hypothetical protein